MPLGNGVLCLGYQTLGFVLRLPPTTSDILLNMTHPLDMTQPPSPLGQILPGSTWYFQAWHREQALPSFFNFSDGLQVTFDI